MAGARAARIWCYCTGSQAVWNTGCRWSWASSTDLISSRSIFPDLPVAPTFRRLIQSPVTHPLSWMRWTSWVSEKTALLGFSMGGMIAQQIALDYPDRIETLVLYGSAARGDLPHRFESWDAAIARIERDGVEAVIQKTSSTWFVEGESHPYFPMAREAGRGANKESCVVAMRAIQKWSSIERLPELKIPTLVIVGDKDRSTTPGDSVVLWENIAGSQFCVIPGSAHGTHAEKPDLFNKVVCDFLVEHTTAVSTAS